MTDHKHFTLSDGTEVTLDAYKMSRKEFKRFYTGEMEDEESIPMFSRITGLEEEYLDNMAWLDWRTIVIRFRELVTGPIEADPNSASESTSD